MKFATPRRRCSRRVRRSRQWPVCGDIFSACELAHSSVLICVAVLDTGTDSDVLAPSQTVQRRRSAWPARAGPPRMMRRGGCRSCWLSCGGTPCLGRRQSFVRWRTCLWHLAATAIDRYARPSPGSCGPVGSFQAKSSFKVASL